MKLAILDLDGTLYNGTLIFDAIQYGHEKGFFKKNTWDYLSNHIYDYRIGKIHRYDLFPILYSSIGLELQGYGLSEILNFAREVWQIHRKNLFEYAPELILLLKQHDYTIILLSGTLNVLITEVAKELDIPLYRGSRFSLEDEVFTQDLCDAPSTSFHKTEILDELVSGHKIEWNLSLALGDSISEAGIMQRVGLPFVFEPQEKEIKLLAKEEGWKTVGRNTVIKEIREELTKLSQRHRFGLL